MKYILAVISILLFPYCYKCDYKSKVKLPSAINSITIQGQLLSNDTSFNFPYGFSGGQYWSDYNYGQISDHLNDFLNSGNVNVIIDSLDGTLNIDFIGTTKIVNNMNVVQSGDTLIIPFLQSNCE